MRKTLILLASTLVLASCNQSQVIRTSEGDLELIALSDNAVRVRLCGDEQMPQLEELIYLGKVKAPKFDVKKSNGQVKYSLDGISVIFDEKSETLSFLDASGNEMLHENAMELALSEVSGQPCYSVRTVFDSPEGEHLYGTGQFQDGYLDVRGLTRRLTQVNTQISIPFVLSSRGYGLLWNNYGLVDFNPSTGSVLLSQSDDDSGSQMVNATGTAGNRREMRFYTSFEGSLTVPEEGEYSLLLDCGQAMSRKQYLAIDGDIILDYNNTWLPPTTSTIVTLSAGAHSVEVRGVRGDDPSLSWRKVDNTTTFSSPVATALDFTVFAGSADEIIGSYRRLTGEAPEMPEWALGYVHCRERYSSQDEILQTVKEFRDRDIPLDVIVQDWQWWGKYGWNAMRFDEDHYPDVPAMMDQLHDMDVKLMLSVWSKVDRKSVLGQSLEKNGYYIDDTEWIDFFNKEATGFYWQNFRDSLVRKNRIDAWWFDATEPENDDLAGRLVGPDGIAGDFYRNVYPLMVNRVMYEGLSQERPGDPQLVLTRSAFTGIQRYGIVTWSGDVGNDFGTLRRQIAGGLGQMSAGVPWWTYDAGGFFRPRDQYDDPAYQERMIRWIQTSVFLPIMRVHGYMSRTEPWMYSDETYRIFTDCIRLRYELLPYIKECARKVSEEGYTMMRPLLFDFPQDEEALLQDCEYMFGPDYLVCPITEAAVDVWRVYLPENAGGWTDIKNGNHYQGGQYIDYPVDIETLPVFKKLRQS